MCTAKTENILYSLSDDVEQGKSKVKRKFATLYINKNGKKPSFF